MASATLGEAGPLNVDKHDLTLTNSATFLPPLALIVIDKLCYTPPSLALIVTDNKC